MPGGHGGSAVAGVEPVVGCGSSECGVSGASDSGVSDSGASDSGVSGVSDAGVSDRDGCGVGAPDCGSVDESPFPASADAVGSGVAVGVTIGVSADDAVTDMTTGAPATAPTVAAPATARASFIFAAIAIRDTASPQESGTPESAGTDPGRYRQTG